MNSDEKGNNDYITVKLHSRGKFFQNARYMNPLPTAISGKEMDFFGKEIIFFLL